MPAGDWRVARSFGRAGVKLLTGRQGDKVKERERDSRTTNEKQRQTRAQVVRTDREQLKGEEAVNERAESGRENKRERKVVENRQQKRAKIQERARDERTRKRD